MNNKKKGFKLLKITKMQQYKGLKIMKKTKIKIKTKSNNKLSEISRRIQTNFREKAVFM